MLQRHAITGEEAGDAQSAPNLKEEYRRLAAQVDAARSALDRYPDAACARVSAAADAYAPLKKAVGRRAPGGRVTNAWLKMAEMWREYGLGQPATYGLAPGAPLRAFFNGELPGAFVSAARHYAGKAGVELEWCASSLYPDAAPGSRGKGALGDRGIIGRDRDRWLMDGTGRNADDRWPGAGARPPNDGDMTSLAKAADIAGRARERLGGPANLYTSDIGVGVGSDYLHQEELNLRPHLGQALCGLLALAPGGVLIVKMYTLFTPLARSVVAALAAHFRRLELCKPATSRPANSEVYVVGLGFDPPEGYRERLLEAFALMETLPPEGELAGYSAAETPAPVRAGLFSASAALGRAQVRALQRHVDLLQARGRGAWEDELRLLTPAQQKARVAWLTRHAP